jgi:hypothetical protein
MPPPSSFARYIPVVEKFVITVHKGNKMARLWLLSQNYLLRNAIKSDEQYYQLTPDPIISHIEIYSTGKTEAKYPSKWVTEIFIPVLSKIIPVKAYTPSCKKSCYHKGRHSYRCN